MDGTIRALCPGMTDSRMTPTRGIRLAAHLSIRPRATAGALAVLVALHAPLAAALEPDSLQVNSPSVSALEPESPQLDAPSDSARGPDSLSSLRPSTRVWVWSPAARKDPVIGRIVATRGDTLILAPDLMPAITVPVPIDARTRLKVSAEQGSRASRGLAVGLGVGLLVGGVVWLHEASAHAVEAVFYGLGGRQPPHHESKAILFPLAGAGLGLLVGSRIKSDRWVEVPRNAEGRLEFSYAGGTPRVAAVVRF